MNNKYEESWERSRGGSYCGPGYSGRGMKTSFGQKGSESHRDPVSELFKFSLDLLMCSPSMKFTKWCTKKYLEENPNAVEEWLKEEGLEASEAEMMEKYGYLKEIGSETDTPKGDAGGSV